MSSSSRLDFSGRRLLQRGAVIRNHGIALSRRPGMNHCHPFGDVHPNQHHGSHVLAQIESMEEVGSAPS